MPKVKTSKKTKGAQTVQMFVQPVIVVNENTSVFYINHADVSFSSHDFSISASRAPSKLSPPQMSEAEETGQIRLVADVQLVIAPTALPGLIRALEESKAKYEKQFSTSLRDTGRENA